MLVFGSVLVFGKRIKIHLFDIASEMAVHKSL